MNTFPLMCLVLTGLLLTFAIFLLIKHKMKSCARQKKRVYSKQVVTASEITGVLDIKDQFLYSRNGQIFTYLKIIPVSLDLLSFREKELISSILSAELSRETKPFKLIALSRPVDITPLLDEYATLFSASNDAKQKELLQLEMNQMKQYMNSGEVIERQFFIALWDKYFPGCEPEVLKRTQDFAQSFHAASVGCEILKEDGIIRLINMIHNPAFIHLEDTDYREFIPRIEQKGELC